MEYAQARMQARLGAAPEVALWQRLGRHDALPAYLVAARATVLAGWVAGIGERADAHQIELALRQRWREAVTELACWMPGEWQPAVRWTAALADLPGLAWLSAGGAPEPWMHQDPAFEAYLGGELAVQLAGRESWLQEWRSRWPGGSDDDAQALERLIAAIERWLGALAERPEGAVARVALEQYATRWFRQLAARPPAAFAYLLLVALDLGRLRAALVLRALELEPVAS